jgi:predicted MPP superfamily phosphohydrolase
MMAPDGGSKTPVYYRNQPFAAWLRLTSVDRLRPDAYLSQFSPEFPDCDETLYGISAENRSLFPQPSDDLTPIEVPHGGYILHISDLHFGSSQQYGQRFNRLLDRIHEVREHCKPGVSLLVVSGDLITGQPPTKQRERFEAARQFLESLVSDLGLRNEHVVMVPGNHDILLGPAQSGEVAKVAFDYGPTASIKEFMRKFYDVERPNLDWTRRFRFPDIDVIFVGLNSVRLPERGSHQFGYGDRGIYLPKLRRVLDTLQSERIQGFDRPTALCLVLHHHLLPVSHTIDIDQERQPSLTVDARQILEDCQEFGVDLILHGHQHQPFVGTYRLASPTDTGGFTWPSAAFLQGPLIVGMGSASVQVSPWNTCGLYRITRESIEVKLIGYTPEHQPLEIAKDISWPVRDKTPVLQANFQSVEQLLLL